MAQQTTRVTWVPEEEAAKQLGLKPRTFREHCKSASLPINWRSTNGRNYMYCQQDLDKYMLETSTITH